MPKISVGESFTVALLFLEKGEYQIFTTKIFCLTVPKISVGDWFILALISGTKNVWRRRGGVSKFSVKNFLSHSADENFRTRILYCCINFGYRKSLEERGEGEVSRFSVEKFLSHSAENFCRGILYCCINFFGRGEYQNFPSKIFCLTVPKFSVGESFTVALISGSEKVWIGGWEYQDFPLKNFCLTVPKTSVGESFTVALFFGEEGGIKILRRKILSHSAENFRRE